MTIDLKKEAIRIRYIRCLKATDLLEEEMLLSAREAIGIEKKIFELAEYYDIPKERLMPPSGEDHDK
jgi:hypothetical protein